MVVLDDSHATGALGRTGRGTAEHCGVFGEVDIITSTLGKALGGAAGGFTAGSTALCDYLIQRSRPQLFSNALPPTVAASALAAVEYLEAHPERVTHLHENAQWFRNALIEAGFKPLAGETPIIPVILGETSRAIQMSELLLKEGVFVTGFGYPVVPQGQARVRCQISAAHTREDGPGPPASKSGRQPGQPAPKRAACTPPQTKADGRRTLAMSDPEPAGRIPLPVSSMSSRILTYRAR